MFFIYKVKNQFTVKEWKTFDVICCKCDKKFKIKEYGVDTPKKEKYYCSRSCANSHTRTDESKLKTSNTINELIKNGNKFGFLSEEYKQKHSHNFETFTKKCPICEKDFNVRPSELHRTYCSKTCYLNDKHCEFRNNGKGGKRIGSGRGKSGWYKSYWCDSSWELAWVIYNLDHDIKFERNYEGFEYDYENKKYMYYPDFISDNKYYEIKGYIDEKNKNKISQFKYDLTIIDKKTIKPYIDYVVEKYGKDFIELYEGNPHKPKNNTCVVCGREAVNVYCSQKCAGHGVKLLYNGRKIN